ncbi:MAG: hypothetical protein SGJ09_16045 [Phycisphaerae bacterium]|nr:hypothetical protein [Phycisphaerae bacterium]
MFWKRRVEPSLHGSHGDTAPDDAFNRLLVEARLDSSPRGRAAYRIAFWDLAWQTDPWHVLVAPSARAAGRLPSMMIVNVDGAACALVYSSPERAARSSKCLGLPARGQPRASMHLARDQACDVLCSLTDASAVLFNPDDPAWMSCVPIAELASQYESRFDRLTPRMFGRFGEAVNRGGAPLRERLVRRLLDAPEWWFVTTESRRSAPALLTTSKGISAVPLYTDAERARRGAARTVAASDENASVPTPMVPRDGTSYLRRLHERQRSEIVAVVVNDVPGETGEPAALPIVELLAAAELRGW